MRSTFALDIVERQDYPEGPLTQHQEADEIWGVPRSDRGRSDDALLTETLGTEGVSEESESLP